MTTEYFSFSMISPLKMPSPQMVSSWMQLFSRTHLAAVPPRGATVNRGIWGLPMVSAGGSFLKTFPVTLRHLFQAWRTWILNWVISLSSRKVKKTDDSSSVGGNKSISGMLIGQVLEDVFAVRVFTTRHENCQNFKFLWKIWTLGIMIYEKTQITWLKKWDQITFSEIVCISRI